MTKMKKKLLTFLFYFGLITTGFAQLKTFSMEEVERLRVQKPKPILVFVHTNWCKYCALMAQTTFKNQAVIDLLNNDFYFVSLNAESTASIRYNQHTFVYKPTGTATGIHELAAELATINGVVSYPSTIILDAENTILYQKNSFLNAQAFLEITKASLDFFKKN